MFNIPTTNPKHKRKRIQSERQKELSSSDFNTKRLMLMGVIFVVVVAAVILIVINAEDIFNSRTDDDVSIENGDYVEFSYKIWVDDNGDGSAIDEWDEGNPDNIEHQSTITKIIYFKQGATNNTYSSTFVTNLLGLKVDGTKTITFDAAVDEDEDGIDDITDEPIIGFQSFPSLKGKAMIIQVDIHSITKLGEEGYP